jgi:dipeptidyl aminopeptidase/acylaminoacyl peptidase
VQKFVLARWLLCLSLAGCASVTALSVGELNNLPEASTQGFFFTSGDGKAEAYISRPRGQGPYPLMLMLHGHSWVGIGARRLLPAAEFFASELCYATLALSLPGYGRTEIAGSSTAESTRRAVHDALALAKQIPWVDGQRIYIYGFSRGAVVASALINQIAGVKGTLLVAGAYDLPRLYRDTESIWIRKLLNPNGERMPQLENYLPETERWNAPTLIVHGIQDGMIPVSQAKLLGDRLQSLGKPHRLVLLPGRGHWLRLDEIKTPAVSFLQANGGSACPASDP